jgi:RimJ/RimL family protein N-acetyltransferase
VELEQEAFGLIQWYRWADYPEHAAQLGAGPDSAGIDLAIGNPQLVGRGLGSALVRRFLDRFVFTDSSIHSCIADPETANQRSLRAFDRAGFRPVREVILRGENAPRTVVEKLNPAATTSATR